MQISHPDTQEQGMAAMHQEKIGRQSHTETIDNIPHIDYRVARILASAK